MKHRMPPKLLGRKYLTELGACTFHPFRLVGAGVNLMRDREEKSQLVSIFTL